MAEAVTKSRRNSVKEVTARLKNAIASDVTESILDQSSLTQAPFLKCSVWEIGPNAEAIEAILSYDSSNTTFNLTEPSSLMSVFRSRPRLPIQEFGVSMIRKCYAGAIGSNPDDGEDLLCFTLELLYVKDHYTTEDMKIAFRVESEKGMQERDVTLMAIRWLLGEYKKQNALAVEETEKAEKMLSNKPNSGRPISFRKGGSGRGRPTSQSYMQSRSREITTLQNLPAPPSATDDDGCDQPSIDYDSFSGGVQSPNFSGRRDSIINNFKGADSLSIVHGGVNPLVNHRISSKKRNSLSTAAKALLAMEEESEEANGD